jgi:pSer/pThr/pTyr-binding forkhead associated (FHA) protein
MPEGIGRNADVGRMPEGIGRNADVGRMPEGIGRSAEAGRAPPLAIAERAPPVAASTTRARLILILRDGGEGPSYPLGESTDIGRNEGHIVITEDKYISPRHARILLRGGTFTVRDLESTNGIFVRIPFARFARDEQAALAMQAVSGEGPRNTNLEREGPRNTNQEREPARNSDLDTSSEQVLADQDLFLVGQQVLRFEVVKHADEGFGVASDQGTLLFGTPAAPRFARLSQRTVEGVSRDVFHLKKAETVIGREQGDIVFADDPFLSRRHAVMRVHPASAPGTPRRFTLADLGSSNGTFLQVREEVRLRHGDHFRIGQQLFRFDT